MRASRCHLLAGRRESETVSGRNLTVPVKPAKRCLAMNSTRSALLTSSTLAAFGAALVVAVGTGPAPAAEPDPAALLDAVRASRLDPASAVRVENVELDTGLARFVMERGTVFPIAPVGQGALEIAFVGEGRMVLEPPDEIEAGQLELFTGGRRLDEAVSEAVFVIGDDAAARSLLARPRAEPDPELTAPGDLHHLAREPRTPRPSRGERPPPGRPGRARLGDQLLRLVP